MQITHEEKDAIAINYVEQECFLITDRLKKTLTKFGYDMDENGKPVRKK